MPDSQTSIAFYDAKPYDRDYFSRDERARQHGIRYVMMEELLGSSDALTAIAAVTLESVQRFADGEDSVAEGVVV